MPEEHNGSARSGSETESTPEEALRELGEEFKALGGKLAAALRSLWRSEQSRQVVAEVEEGITSVSEEVSRLVDQLSGAPEAAQAREHARKIGERARELGEKTIRDIQPELIDALRQMNNELQKLVERLEKETPTGGTDAGHAKE